MAKRKKSKHEKKTADPNMQLDVLKAIRKPILPSKIHTTKGGKKGYDRKEGKRIERDSL